MTSESEVKTRFVAEQRKAGHYARRIEDKHGVGIPDVYCAWVGGISAWMEFKLVRHGGFEASPRQWIELERILPTGVGAVIVGYWQSEDAYFLHLPCRERIRVVECYKVPRVGADFGKELYRWWNRSRTAAK